MKVGIVVDSQEDYSLGNKALHFKDFSVLDEISYIKESLELSGHIPVWTMSPRKFSEHIKVQKNDFDIVLNLSEGVISRNREGLVPSLCEIYGIPYTGTDAFGLSFTNHKFQTKQFFENLGIPTPKGFLFIPQIHSSGDIEKLHKYSQIDFPVVVRPNREGSSMGLSLAENMTRLKEQVLAVVELYDQEVICDEYISGQEFGVPVIGTGITAKALGVGEYCMTDGSPIALYTSEIKKNHATRVADIDDSTGESIRRHAQLAHQALSLRDVSRVDLRFQNGRYYFTEITPTPGLERDSIFPFFFEMHDMEFHEFIDGMVTAAWNRWNDFRHKEFYYLSSTK